MIAAAITAYIIVIPLVRRILRGQSFLHSHSLYGSIVSLNRSKQNCLREYYTWKGSVFQHSLNNPFLVIDDSSYLKRCTVRRIGNLDSGTRCTCMNNLAASDIHCHMTDSAVASVEEQITRLCI